MPTILITGANGFVGKNLQLHLSERKDIQVRCFTRANTVDELPALLNGADFVFHLAGVNRPQDPAAFVVGNAGLTQALWLPLVHLERSQGAMRQKDLAQALALDSSSIVRLIDGLQAQGWVERLDDADRRVKRIQLTAAGQDKVEAVKQVVAEVRGEVMQDFPAELLDQTLGALDTLLSKMAAMEAIATGAEQPDS